MTLRGTPWIPRSGTVKDKGEEGEGGLWEEVGLKRVGDGPLGTRERGRPLWDQKDQNQICYGRNPSEGVNPLGRTPKGKGTTNSGR